MFGHYLLTLYRSLTRHRLYAALNVLGLAVGVGVFLVLALLVRYETGFDRWVPDADNIYRLSATYTYPGRAPDALGSSPGAALPFLRADYPQIRAGVRVLSDVGPISNGSIVNNETYEYVDPSLFDVFDLSLVAGDRKTALASPANVVISESIARKYFGTTDVIGKPLIISSTFEPQTRHISGVLKDLPGDTQLSLHILMLPRPGSDQEKYQRYWGWSVGYTYLRFNNAAQASVLAADLPRFVEHRAAGSGDTQIGDHPSRTLHFNLDPLPALHFGDAARKATPKPGTDSRLVYSLGAVGVLTLLIAALNYVNLATARAAVRAKEIAVRKVLGATRAALVGQFLAEAVAFAALAALIGLALAELALPAVNAFGGASLHMTYWGAGGVLPWLLLLTLVIGLGAGLYPALLLSRFEPAPVLAAARTSGGGRMEARIRATLIGAQFVVAITFAICTLVIASQAEFLRTADRGFQRQGLILVDSMRDFGLNNRRLAVLDAFRRTPGVVSVSSAGGAPGELNNGLAGVRRSPAKGDAAVVAAISTDVVGDDYLKTYGGRLVAGRMFDRIHRQDDFGPLNQTPRKGATNIVLNERAVRALGFSSPAAAIGQTVYIGDDLSLPVIGVLRDIHLGSPMSPVEAAGYVYSSYENKRGVAAVRYAGVSDAEMMARLRATWRRVAPEIPFDAKTADAGLSAYFVPDQQRARLFTVASVLAVAIGCVGLYGLASFNTARRYKEIGIRKTLGASTGDILRLLLVQILRPILIANLIAWPLAWFAMRGWLASFDQRIALSPLYFVAATLLALAIACLTVIAQSLRLARSEPARALRHE